MSKITLTTEQGVSALFHNMKGFFVDNEHKDHPDNEYGLNYPRAEGRFPGYQNPILGDDGIGKIARWEYVDTHALRNLVRQMIAHYMRDREWYKQVRCREALWNMYKRLEWWVNQQVEPGDQDYAQALKFIRENIYHILDAGTVEAVLKSYTFHDGVHLDFESIGSWYNDIDGYLTSDYTGGGEDWVLRTVVDYNEDGYVVLDYSVLGDSADFRLIQETKSDSGEWEFVETDDSLEEPGVLWRYDSGSVHETSKAFKNIRIYVDKGVHRFTVAYNSPLDGTSVRISGMRFVELRKDEEKSPNRCPNPYTYSYCIDYGNFFEPTGYERVTFSTVDESTTTDFVNTLRYVSTQEHTEWVLTDTMRGEYVGGNIFKVPLERLRQTMPTKMVLEWDIKAKGYVRFEYLLESNGGADLKFFVNDHQMTDRLLDTDGEWVTVEVNLPLGQRYKLDWIVTSNVRGGLGAEKDYLNALYIKNIEIIEKTDAAGGIMPDDFELEGEAALEGHNNWVVDTRLKELRTQYYGYPDDEEDMVRDFDFTLTGENDGVLSFEYEVGTESGTQNLNVRDKIFRERDRLANDPNPTVWKGSVEGTGVPDITIDANMGEFDFGTPKAGILTKEGTTATYSIKEDGLDWMFDKMMEISGEAQVISPPKEIVEEGYVNKPLEGSVDLGPRWSGDSSSIRLKTERGIGSTTASVRVGNAKGGYVLLRIDGKLADNSDILVTRNGSGYMLIEHTNEFPKTLKIPAVPGTQIKFEYTEHSPEGAGNGEGGSDINISFAGAFVFDGQLKPFDEDMYDNAEEPNGLYEQFSDSRGREVDITIPVGSLERRGSWYTNDGFINRVVMLPGDKLDLNYMVNRVEYVDYEGVKKDIEEWADAQEGPWDSDLIFRETFNPQTEQGRTVTSPGWKVEDVFEILDMGNRGDEVMAHRGGSGPGSVHRVDFTNIPTSFAEMSLSFEYGAQFQGGKLAVLAQIDEGEYKPVWSSQNDNITPKGTLVRGLHIPKGTSRIVFEYTEG